MRLSSKGRYGVRALFALSGVPPVSDLGPSLYARGTTTVRREPLVATAFVIGSLMHAAGHASVAWLVGPVLRVGFGGASPVVNGSTRLPSLVASVSTLLRLALSRASATGRTSVTTEVSVEADLLPGLRWKGRIDGVIRSAFAISASAAAAS